MSYEKYRNRLMMRYPAIEDLKAKARKRIPFVAWEYLQTGTGQEELIARNLEAFRAMTLTPRFCKGQLNPDTTTKLLGRTYSVPFGIAPVGLTGLMWPRAEVMLAKTANTYKIPYCLSTVATETPETVGPHVGNVGWFQLYPPRGKELRHALLTRARESGFHTLVVTADVPTPSRRERTKRAGLDMPPRITPRLIWQGITHPRWAIPTLRRGLPRLRTIEAYSEFNSMMSVGSFVDDQLRGNLSWDYCAELKDQWQGPILVKGILHPADAEKAVQIGLDGVIVSNHGGRQFDGAPAALHALPEIVNVLKGRAAVLFDSGVRSGLDVLKVLSLGADFVLLGRAFIYGIAAIGPNGGDHVVELLRDDLTNNMVQMGVESPFALYHPNIS